MTAIILQIGGSEIFLIVFFVLLFFGSKAIPDIAKTLGKGMREFQKATDEIKREINNSAAGDLKKDFDDIKSSVQRDIHEITSSVTNDVNEMTTSVQKEVNAVTSSVQQDVENMTSTINKETESISKDLNKPLEG